MNYGNERLAYLDVWISGPKLTDRWIQVQREFDANGDPIGPWPSSRWNHECVVIQDDFESSSYNMKSDTSAINRTLTKQYYAKRPAPFVFLAMGGMTMGNKVNNEIWNGTISMVGWPIVGRWHKINQYTACPIADGSAKFTGFKKTVNTNGDYCQCGATSCFQGQVCVASSSNCAGRTTKEADLSMFSPRTGHCSLRIDVKGYSKDTNLWKSVQTIPTDAYPSVEASQKIEYENRLNPLNHIESTSTLIFVIGGLSNNFLGDVWMSSDKGQQWEQRSKFGLSSRYFHGCGFLGRTKMLVLGGRGSQSTDVRNDVWASNDYGTTWNIISPLQKKRANMWAGRYRFSVISFVAKSDAIQTMVDVAGASSSNSGTSYNTKDADLHQPLSLSNHMVGILGGYTSAGQSIFFNDFWMTNDGIVWTKQAMDWPVWNGRSGHSTLLLPGQYSKDAASAAAARGREFSNVEDAQIHALPNVATFGGRTAKKRLSDVWVRSGPILLTSASTRQRSRFGSTYYWLTVFVAVWCFCSCMIEVDAYLNEDFQKFSKEATAFVNDCTHRNDNELDEHIVLDEVPTPTLPVDQQQHFDACNVPKALALSTKLTNLCLQLTGDTTEETNKQKSGGETEGNGGEKGEEGEEGEKGEEGEEGEEGSASGVAEGASGAEEDASGTKGNADDGTGDEKDSASGPSGETGPSGPADVAGATVAAGKEAASGPSDETSSSGPADVIQDVATASGGATASGVGKEEDEGEEDASGAGSTTGTTEETESVPPTPTNIYNDPSKKISLLVDNQPKRMRAPSKAFVFLRNAKEIEEMLKREKFEHYGGGMSLVAEKILHLVDDVTQFLDDITNTIP